MSYCRFGKHSDVYVLGTIDGEVECCGCRLATPAVACYIASAKDMIKHLNEHVARGHKVLHYAFELLRIDACADRLIDRGYEQKESRWNLPRQLGLTIVANTDPQYQGPYPGVGYPTDYHCVGKPEVWVESWAERVAELPVLIAERRRVLQRIAKNPTRKAALQAALVARPDLPSRIVLDIASAELHGAATGTP